jgi:membrane fusion protein, multidrug efflux system
MKKAIIGLLAITVALAGGFFLKNKFWGSTSAPNNPPATNAPSAKLGSAEIALDGYVVRASAMSENLVLSGTLRPAEEVEIHSEISGRMTEMRISEGKLVQKGDLLAKLFDDDLQGQLEKLRQQKTIAERAVERLTKLLAANGSSQSELDVAQNQLNNILADTQIATANLTKTEIRAPFSGRLGLRNISPGAYLNPTMILTTLYQINPLKIDFSVPENRMSNLKEGAILNFTVDGIKGEFTGKVSVIEPKIDENTRSVKVRALVQNQNGALKPGAFAKIDLNLKNFQGLTVPSQAIVPGPRDKKIIVSRNGKAEMVVVSTGQRDENRTEITSGLVAGDTIVMSGLMFVKPGMGLKFRKIEGN